MPCPTLEELRERYRNVMNDSAVTDISYWNIPNTDAECDDEAYLARALDNGDCLNAKIEDALDDVHTRRV